MTQTQPYRDDFGATIYNANSLELLKELPDNSIDSIVTDPPYEIGFMGRGWDNTGIAYNVELWKECLRVLKPGGHALVFGATRTYHRVAVAIEDAGFEIRDSIHWVYGQGFPKSMDISKAIDKQAGAEREVVGKKPYTNQNIKGGHLHAGHDNERIATPITAPATDAAKQWGGWGTALKPAHEPIVVARKPLDGTVANNVLTHGVGGLNIDGTRVGTSGGARYQEASEHSKSEPAAVSVYASSPKVEGLGRFPANFLLTHSPECEETGETVSDTMTGGFGNGKIGMSDVGQGFGGANNVEWQSRTTETPVFQCVPGCPVAEMNEQSGHSKSTPSSGHTRKGNTAGDERTPAAAGLYGDGAWIAGSAHSDAGGASRFFPAFQYEGKATSKERPVHPETGKGHPTVKPLELMRWLVRLVTPVGGTVLEPFAGSGATVEAALLEGMKVVAIDLEADHMPLIDSRINRWARGESPVKAVKKSKAVTAAKIVAKGRVEAAEALFDLPEEEA